MKEGIDMKCLGPTNFKKENLGSKLGLSICRQGWKFKSLIQSCVNPYHKIWDLQNNRDLGTLLTIYDHIKEKKIIQTYDIRNILELPRNKEKCVLIVENTSTSQKKSTQVLMYNMTVMGGDMCARCSQLLFPTEVSLAIKTRICIKSSKPR